MNKIHQDKVKKFLDTINIEEIAKKTGFQKRKPKKITPYYFLLSFFIVFLKKNYSLRAWAIELSVLVDYSVSFQAIAKKLQCRQLGFIKTIFSKAMEQYFNNNIYNSQKKIMRHFSKVLIEDSSCIKLYKILSAHFPGAKNKLTKKSATCRIQFCFDIKSNTFENVELSSFVKNDYTFAENITSRIEANALVIRDLGYLKFEVLEKIDDLKAFFISRYKSKMKVFHTKTEEQINFIKELKKLDRNKIKRLDFKAKIGVNKKIGVRIIALKLTDKQELDRRQKLKRRRRKNMKSISKETKYLMSWNIFITNIEGDLLEAEEVYELYSLRWHIEIIFKNWKSNFKIVEILNSFKGENPIKPEFLLYLCMAFMVLIYVPKLNHYHKVIFEKYGEHLSPYKFASFIANQFELLFSEDEEKIIRILLRHCCYDKRKDRVNLYVKIYEDAA